MYGYYQSNGHSKDPDTDEAYGDNEWGYFSKKELENTRINMGGIKLPLERDSYFKPKKLGEVIGRKKSNFEKQATNQQTATSNNAAKANNGG